MTEQQKQAVRNAIVTLHTLAHYSLTPTQTKMAERGVRELLWLLKVDQIELQGRLYSAHPPEGKIIDIPSQALARPSSRLNRTGT